MKYLIIVLFSVFAISCSKENQETINDIDNAVLKGFLANASNSNNSLDTIFNNCFYNPNVDEFNGEILILLKKSLNSEKLKNIENLGVEKGMKTFKLTFEERTFYVLLNETKIISIAPMLADGKIKGWL